MTNIIALSKQHNTADTPSFKDFKSLKQAYIKLLNHVQPNIWHPTIPPSSPFVFDQEIIKNFMQAFFTKSSLTDKKAAITAAPLASMQKAAEALEEGRVYIEQFDKNLYFLIQLAINSLFFARSPHQGGGSTSNAIGVIWCSNRPEWTIIDRVEFFMHELTHNLLFIDELKYGHYTSLAQLADPENFAPSSILKEKRPLDKALHFTALNAAGRYTLQGPNGVGKSCLLLWLKQQWGTAAFYLPTHIHNLLFNHTQGLSSGQKMIAALQAITQFQDSFQVLLLDEWDANLDAINLKRTDAVIEQLAKNKKIIEVRHRQ